MRMVLYYSNNLGHSSLNPRLRIIPRLYPHVYRYAEESYSRLERLCSSSARREEVA
jgi:hypothetical protein